MYEQSSKVLINEGTDNGLAAGSDMVLSGTKGSVSIDVAANDTAKTVANLMNAQTQNTGVSATAETKIKLSSLSATGTVSFTVNSTSIGTVTLNDASDLRDLSDAINAKAGTTGVTSKVGASNAELILTDSDGDDIKIGSYDHSVNGSSLTVTALDQDEATVSTSQTTLLKDTTFTAGAANEVNSVTVSGQLNLTSHSAFTLVTTEDGAADAATTAASNQTTTADTLVPHGEFFHGSTEASGGSAAAVTTTSTLTSVSTADIGTSSGAATAIKAIDSALSKIADARGTLGAQSNRLDSTVNNLTSITTNLSASKSGIEDADFAAETTNLAKAQILQQASTAMLAQANASKQNVLSLLQG